MAGTTPAQEATADGDRGRGRRIAGWVVTSLACVVVFVALVVPDQIGRLTPGAFVRIPVEGLVGVAILVALPGRARRVVAAVAGAVLGLLTIVRLVDLGFRAVLDRPFDPVLDWSALGDAMAYLTATAGRGGAIGTAVGAGVLAVVIVAAMTFAVARLTRLAAGHRPVAVRVVAVLSVAWLALAALGTQIVSGVPVAAGGVAALARQEALQVPASLRDREEFAAESAADAFGSIPAAELLTGLRGKDVVLAFVESYGRVAVTDPAIAPQVDALLDDGTRRLAAAGFASRSGFLTSPIAGGGSWMAHATLLSGVRIDNQQRYRDLVASDRLTLTSAFQRADWRTVAVMPGTAGPWPEATFYGLDRVHEVTDLGYRGPRFSFSAMPDQYTLSAFRRLEDATPGRGPLMSEIVLTSSHAPWAPLPKPVAWGDVGDGSVFDSQAAPGDAPEAILTRDPALVRADYRDAVEYSLGQLISYVQTYGDDNLVLVFLGDHQPAPVVTGDGAGRDVPITIVAKDPAVLDRISGWGWQDGLRPGPRAPVWPMESFRDRFLTAFGPQAPQAR